MPDRLRNTLTGTITGTNPVIDYYHGLTRGSTPVVVDDFRLDLTSNQEAANAATPRSAILTPNAFLPIAGETITIGKAALNEVLTYRVTAALPFEVTIGASVALCLANAVTVFNACTQQNLYADVTGGTIRVRGSIAPGNSTLDNGMRDLSSNAVTAGTAGGGPWAWAGATGGAGTVAGSPQYSLIYNGTDFLRIRVRGMRTTDSLNYRLRVSAVHSFDGALVPQKATAADGSINVGVSQFSFTSAGTNFITPATASNRVIPAEDFLVIADPVNRANNGQYRVVTVPSEHVLIVESTRPFRATQANLTFGINTAAVLRSMDGEVQVPFELPSGDAHIEGTPSADPELPNSAIETVEIADGNCTDVKLNIDRGKWGGLSISGPASTTNISAMGANCTLNVDVNGAGATLLTVPNPADFDLTTVGGILHDTLNTGVKIAQALTILAATAAQDVIFGWSTLVQRFYVYGTLRATGARTVVLTNGAGNNIADDLQLGVGNSGTEYTGSDGNLEALIVWLKSSTPLVGSILPAALSFEPVINRSQLGGGAIYFKAGACGIADVITLSATEFWTGRAVPNPLLHEFLATGVPAADCAAFVAAINAGAACTVPTQFRSVQLGGNLAAVFLITAGTVGVTLAESTATVRFNVTQSVQNLAAADRRLVPLIYTVDAADVAIWAAVAANEVPFGGAIDSTFQPFLEGEPSCRTAAGIVKPLATVGFRFLQSGANQWILAINDSAAVLAATDVLQVSVNTAA